MSLPGERIGAQPPLINDRRGDVMVEPEAVSAMLRLTQLGWGTRRIAAELGVSRGTVKDYITAENRGTVYLFQGN